MLHRLTKIVRPAALVLLTLAAATTAGTWVVVHIPSSARLPRWTLSLGPIELHLIQKPRLKVELGVDHTLVAIAYPNHLGLIRHYRAPRDRLPTPLSRRFAGFGWTRRILVPAAVAKGGRTRLITRHRLTDDELNTLVATTTRCLTSVTLPLWALLVLFATYPVLALLRGPLLRRRRRRKGLCLGCGYDLTGNESGVCPECGTTIEVV